MNVSTINRTLGEFPPSMRLIVKLGGAEVSETTVAEAMADLMKHNLYDDATYYGRESFILREHPNKDPARHGHLTMDWW